MRLQAMLCLSSTQHKGYFAHVSYVLAPPLYSTNHDGGHEHENECSSSKMRGRLSCSFFREHNGSGRTAALKHCPVKIWAAKPDEGSTTLVVLTLGFFDMVGNI